VKINKEKEHWVCNL